MKGIILYEDYRGKKVVEAIKLGEVDYTCKSASSDDGWINELSGIRMTSTQAYCNKDDTYDFETGALISLMKMCGADKVVRAFNEAFPKERYNTYIAKFEGELCELKKEYDKVKDLKDFYKKNYEDVKERYGKLGDRNKYLIDDINKKLEYIKEKDEEIKKLKSDKDKSWKIYQRNVQKKQDRINELEAQVKASEDERQKDVEYYEKEIKNLKGNIDELFESDKYSKSLVGKLSFEKHRLEEEKEKLQHEYNLCLNSENALKYTVDSLNKSVAKLNKAIEGYKNDLYNTAKRCKELERGYKASNDDEAKLVEYYQREIKKLEAENEKLKLDCEKLRHGYNDMIICGGRQNGKQYTLLVELFKKLDQKKVDAAYIEAYNTTLPVWQKEFLNQMYGIYKESKEKIELPRTLDINGTVYRKSIQVKDFGEQINKLTVDSLIEQSRAFTRKCVDEWAYKIPTKREEMWEKIFKLHKESDVIIKVKKEDVNTFLHEIEKRIPEITWVSTVKIFETKYTIGNIYGELKTQDVIYFRLSKETTLSYSNNPYIYLFKGFKHIDYLPPMRWDLFEKGRIVIKVEKENYGEFCSRMFAHFDKVGVHAFNHDCKFGYFAFNKDTDYVERILASDHSDTKEINRHKVVDWEDVRDNISTMEDPYDTWTL